MSKNRFLDIFRVTEQDLAKIISAALAEGGDWCDLYFEYTVYNGLLLRDSEVTSGEFHIDFGVGIRVLCGEKTGYAYSESTEMTDMLQAAKAAAIIGGESAGQGKAAHPFRRQDGLTCNGIVEPGLYPSAIAWKDVRHGDFVSFLKKIESSVRAKDSRAIKVVAKLSDAQSEIMMYNSLGELTFDSRPMASVTVSVIFSKDGQNESKTASRSFRTGAEFITDALAEELASEVTGGIDARFEAKRPKGGKMPVVMGAGASGILLHEAMGHAFEADFNRKGQSIFSDKMGRKICPDNINIVDDGTIGRNRGACNFDDEGVPGQKTYMVTDGVLTSYLHDRISAGFYGVPPTGNGRRESFRYNPIPRMRATYMESGKTGPEDIISEVRNGIYVDEFSNGQVKIGEGDFTFYVKNGFLIENGKLTAPVKDINIIGNGPKALADIIAVGNDLRIDNGTWTCGKEQSVPVSCGIPTVLVKFLTVGGNGQ